MKAKFIGKTSMGFVTCKMYNIESKIQIVNNIPCICIYDKNSNTWCPYQSLEAVMKNWIIFRDAVN